MFLEILQEGTKLFELNVQSRGPILLALILLCICNSSFLFIRLKNKPITKVSWHFQAVSHLNVLEVHAYAFLDLMEIYAVLEMTLRFGV